MESNIASTAQAPSSVKEFTANQVIYDRTGHDSRMGEMVGWAIPQPRVILCGTSVAVAHVGDSRGPSLHPVQFA
jgi:serine/threonine protein phosphatase PrpC